MITKVLSASLAAILMMSMAPAEEEGRELYTNGVIDLGIVVRDLDQSAKFYTEVVGLKEVNGFKVPGKVTGDFGLTDNQDVTARVFVAVDAAGKPASKLKMMAFPKAQGKKPDQEFIHSTLGVSGLNLSLTWFFGHSSAPRPCTGVRIGGKSSQQLPAPSYHPQIPEKQQFTPENLETLN